MYDPQIETRARAYYAAREAEREDVVAWLRRQKWTTRVLDRIADAIESGDHEHNGIEHVGVKVLNHFVVGDPQACWEQQMSESISNAHDATVYERGRAHGINEERRAIVAWLREQLSAAEEWESANDWHSGASNAANTCETTMSDAHCCHCADCALNGNDDGIHSDAPHKWRKHRPEYTRRNHRGVKSYSTWVRDECPLCFAAEQERVAIVAWLREQQWTTRVLDIVAGAIERGEHLGADDE